MSVKLDAKTVHDRLTAWLGRTKPSWQGLTVAPMDVVLGSGFSAEIFFVDVEYDEGGQHHRRTLVVRRQPQTFEVVFESDLKLQANMMAALDARGDLPVPSWVGMEDDPSILGAPFLVMGRVEGQAATQRPNYNVEGWLTALTPDERMMFFRNALTALARLHAIDWRDGFTFLDRPDRGAPGLDQYLGYLKDWHAARGQGRPLPIVDTAMRWVLENRPKDTDTCVLWGDPTPSNTMEEVASVRESGLEATASMAGETTSGWALRKELRARAWLRPSGVSRASSSCEADMAMKASS